MNCLFLEPISSKKPEFPRVVGRFCERCHFVADHYGGILGLFDGEMGLGRETEKGYSNPRDL